VGIGGGIPSKKNHIRLGDVVIGMPDGIHGGVVQYDLGKRTVDGFERKGFLCPPPNEWRTAVVEMKSDHKVKSNRVAEFLSQMLEAYPKLQEYSRPGSELDILFPPDSKHVRDEPTCDKCDKTKVIPPRSSVSPEIFYGTIASGDSVIKDAEIRDELCKVSRGALCFEMEAAGLSNGFPCIIIRGICDYADSHKNDQWHPYAAAVAAACAKELLTYIDLAPGMKVSADRNFSDESPMLRSDSIFLQERLLVRADIESFLVEAFSCNGHVRVILHGLPGVG
jgi:nucleoside phosphorylase